MRTKHECAGVIDQKCKVKALSQLGVSDLRMRKDAENQSDSHAGYALYRRLIMLTFEPTRLIFTLTSACSAVTGCPIPESASAVSTGHLVASWLPPNRQHEPLFHWLLRARSGLKHA